MNFRVPFLDLQAINQRDGEKFQAVLDSVLKSGRVLLGPLVEQFEMEFASVVGVSDFVAVGSGLDAITLMLRALELPEKSGVIVPANSFVASALGVVLAGHVPVLADVCEEVPVLDPDRIEERANWARGEGIIVRAVLGVHLYGAVALWDRLSQVSDRNEWILLEDAAQAHGASWRGRRAGSLGYAAAFSFYPGKNLGALSDGGGVSTSNQELAHRIRRFRNYGSSRKYIHEVKGINSRLDELQAGLLSVKLSRLSDDNARRREIATRYVAGIRNRFVKLPSIEAETESSWHIFPLRVHLRQELQEHLSSNGIESLIHYPVPIHRQPCFSESSALSFPHSESWCATELSLPMSPVMTDEQVDGVIDAINAFRGL